MNTSALIRNTFIDIFYFMNVSNNIIYFVTNSPQAILKSQGQVRLEVKEKDADVEMPLRYQGNLPVAVKDALVTSKVNLA